MRSIPARPFDNLILGYLGEIGRHPEIIESAIKASNEEKARSLRPLKYKLAELDRKHRELATAVQNCVETAKLKGANCISGVFMEEAEKLSQEKHQIELERTRLNLDINHRENVVADKQIIADALLRFERVIGKLPVEEQKELVRLIIREISVKQYDPNSDPEPKGKGSFTTRIRTKWYLVNMSLFASGLFPEA